MRALCASVLALRASFALTGLESVDIFSTVEDSLPPGTTLYLNLSARSLTSVGILILYDSDLIFGLTTVA